MSAPWECWKTIVYWPYLISFPIQIGSQCEFYSLGQYGTSTHIFEHRLLSGSEVKRGEWCLIYLFALPFVLMSDQSCWPPEVREVRQACSREFPLLVGSSGSPLQQQFSSPWHRKSQDTMSQRQKLAMLRIAWMWWSLGRHTEIGSSMYLPITQSLPNALFQCPNPYRIEK